MLVPWLGLGATVLCSAVANALAHASNRSAAKYRSYYLMAAISCHGVGFLCFAVALTGLPLSFAYPALVGSSIVAVTVLAGLLFHERPTQRHYLGLAAIILGVVLLHAERRPVPDDVPVATQTTISEEVN